MSSTYFTSVTETEKITFEDGEWVEIKSKLSIADHDKMAQKLVALELEIEPKSRRNGNKPKPVKAHFLPSTVFMLELAIVSWSFKDEDDNPIPLDVEHIGQLRTDVALKLETEIDDRNPT